MSFFCTHFSCSVLGGDDGGQGPENSLCDEHQALRVLLHGARHDPEQPGGGEVLQPGHARPQQLGYDLPPLAPAGLLIDVDTDLLITRRVLN